MPTHLILRLTFFLALFLFIPKVWAQGCACGGGCGGPGTGCGCQYNGACGMTFADNKAIVADGWSGGQLAPDENGKVLDFYAKNVSLCAWLPIAQLDDVNTSPSTRGNDVWGYTSPSGREYAIMGLERGTVFVEVTTPTQPRVVGLIPGPTAIWRDMKTYGIFCYSVNDGFDGPGVQVINISNLDQSTVTLHATFDAFGLKTTHNLAINPQSGYLYLSGSNIFGRGLLALDVRFGFPIFGGFWGDHYVHDSVVVNYTSGPLAGRELAYVSTTEQGMKILDVTNKTSMTVLANGPYPNMKYCHHGWLSEDRQWYFVNDELDEMQLPDLVPSTTSYFFNVSNPANPVYSGSFTNGSKAIDHNPLGRGRFLFEANYRSGMRIWDVGDPLRAREAGYFDTFPDNDDAQFNGAWGVYPLFPSGTVVMSDIERGLFVFNAEAATTPNSIRRGWQIYQ